MSSLTKTFYLWDLAGTLFPEVWEKDKSGFASFNDYVSSIYDLHNIDPADYERCYELPYKLGWFNVTLAEGFPEVLIWAEYNGSFTTGLHETLKWRGEQLKAKYGIDISQYLPEKFSTFDYGNTNVKTPAMLIDIMKKKHLENYSTIVYTDDKPANCKFFLESYNKVKEEIAPMQARTYHIAQLEQEPVKVEVNYWQVGNLFQIRENEQLLNK